MAGGVEGFRLYCTVAMAALKQPWGVASQPQLLFGYRPRALRGDIPERMRAVCALEDFDFREGPREVTKPKFIRSEFPSLVEPVTSGDDASGASKRRGRRPFRKATPLQVKYCMQFVFHYKRLEGLCLLSFTPSEENFTV